MMMHLAFTVVASFQKTMMVKHGLWDTKRKIKSWTGYDGTENIEQITTGLVKRMNLAEEQNLGRQFDWVMSLEVGEHIPAAKESIFLNNIIRHAKTGVVLSWAVPGQPGRNHINNLSNDQVKEKMLKLGFRSDYKAQNIIRKATEVWYFQNTVMVFRPFQRI